MWEATRKTVDRVAGLGYKGERCRWIAFELGIFGVSGSWRTPSDCALK
jgi:hypothetical protein